MLVFVKRCHQSKTINLQKVLFIIYEPMTMDIKKIGFGAASLSAKGGGYGFGNCDDPNDLISYAFELGITHFDTAPIYGFGQSERSLGLAVKNFREKIKIISKSGVTWHDNKRVDMTNDPLITKKMLYQTLKDLNTDYIDHYMIHWPDKKIDIRYAIEVLASAQMEGKIISIGLCNTNEADFIRAQEIVSVESMQFEYNLFNQNSEMLRMKQKYNILSMGWGTFDKGILAGSVCVDRIFEKDDARSWAPWWKKSNWKKKVQFVEDYKKEIFDYALRFSLAEMDISLCGVKKISHLDKIKESLEFNIDMGELKSIAYDFSTFS